MGETTIISSMKTKDGCNCEPGRYRPLGSVTCVPCLEGMTCPFGSDTKNFKVYGGDGKMIPRVKLGYYSKRQTLYQYIGVCMRKPALVGHLRLAQENARALSVLYVQQTMPPTKNREIVTSVLEVFLQLYLSRLFL
jgi:hypothetical protein